MRYLPRDVRSGFVAALPRPTLAVAEAVRFSEGDRVTHHVVNALRLDDIEADVANELTAPDSAIWRTVWINDLIDAGTFHTVPASPTTFAPYLGQSERVVAGGPYTLYDFVSAGDGSYIHKSGGGFFMLGGAGMMAVGAGAMPAGAAFRGIGNANRKAEAEALAQRRWRVAGSGVVHVSQYGFYLHDPNGLHAWSWEPIRSAELLAPRTVTFAGDSDRGPIQWIVESDWAELIFSFWARIRHPAHPQFHSGTWVPPGWSQRVLDSSYDCLGSPPGAGPTSSPDRATLPEQEGLQAIKIGQ
ncbi:MAG: hypothetical protein LKG20_10140 [Tetrasphaera jenkinsii]|nr:hypothetical protein [Tetrasphaera jenkinsii]